MPLSAPEGRLGRFDVVVLGAGPAGLACAAEAGGRGQSVLVLDHQRRPGRKLLLTGGGRCNFSNRKVGPENYLGMNPEFVGPALAGFGPANLVRILEQARVPYEEREEGQLFCKRSADDVLTVLLHRCRQSKVVFRMATRVDLPIGQVRGGFEIATRPVVTEGNAEGPEFPGRAGLLFARKLVVATGGLSYPAVGASPLGHEIARAFGIEVVPPHPALVPFTWSAPDRALLGPLSGVSLEVSVKSPSSPRFRAQILFTHRGLSGPAALQVSSYWRPGETLTIDLLAGQDGLALLAQDRVAHPKASLRSCLARHLPRRLVDALPGLDGLDARMSEIGAGYTRAAAARLRAWHIRPAGTEGYAAAEVTAGGVATAELEATTMQARLVPGLHFAGEVVDVTGQLGGYNLQWAFSSGICAGGCGVSRSLKA